MWFYFDSPQSSALTPAPTVASTNSVYPPHMDEGAQDTVDMIMTAKRICVRIFSNIGRSTLKKCSVRKAISIVGAIFLIWSALLLTGSPRLLPHPQQTVRNRSVMLTLNTHIKNSPDPADWFRNEYLYLYDNVIQDNPLGTYFSDRLGGNAPIGSSHLSFYKREHHKPLKMVLVFVDDPTSSVAAGIRSFFGQQRIECRFRNASKELPSLVVEDIGLPKYSLIFFDEYVTYLAMDVGRKAVLDAYCRRYHVGILAQTHSTRSAEIEYFSDLKLKLQHRMKLTTFKMNIDSDIWRVAKPMEIYPDVLPSSDWTIFITDHDTYMPIAFSTVTSDWQGSRDDVTTAEFGCVTAVHDQGLMDGIQRIILGYDLDFWLNSIVAMDAITFLSNGRFSLPLTRVLQIDIDDMFVGSIGIRTLVKDADEMVNSQERIRQYVPGFTFNLGFSGEYFLKGSVAEQEGDRRIVELAQHFVWFNHMYRHEQPHNVNATKLSSSLAKNVKFAQEHNIPLSSEYMVMPHHSGAYPIYEALYDEWLAYGLVSSSSSEYPKQLPLWGRRGFIYRGIMVLPRQVCGLYTSINKFEEFKGDKSGLDSSIRGGFLFKIFLFTPVLLFMTHMSNYASDQLAQYTFENVIKFVLTWTNLHIVTAPPAEVARRYFQLYPNEATPMWTNPCDYHKHMEILPPHVSCSKFPHFIIVGPQKTGTTALQKFLEAHPMMVSSKEDPIHFEEIQFFSSNNYLNGLDWYQKHFPQPASDKVVLFEKSANYFDNEVTPKRIFTLVPRAKIVIILAEPIRRAYSWYQNIKYHKDPVAMNYSFFEVISAPDTAPRPLRDARNKCVKAGAYAIHLARWLQFFPREQIFLVDGDQLTTNPFPVLNKLQRFINVTPFIDFATKVRYDPVKGFFCRTDIGCLGSVKGRKYPPMDPESKRYLDNYFTDHNTNLKIILNDIGQSYPHWLAETSPN